jgi:hypothetical protein
MAPPGEEEHTVSRRGIIRHPGARQEWASARSHEDRAQLTMGDQVNWPGMAWHGMACLGLGHGSSEPAVAHEERCASCHPENRMPSQSVGVGPSHSAFSSAPQTVSHPQRAGLGAVAGFTVALFSPSHIRCHVTHPQHPVLVAPRHACNHASSATVTYYRSGPSSPQHSIVEPHSPMFYRLPGPVSQCAN